MSDQEKINKLRRTSEECRIDIIEMLTKAGCGHPGGSLSAIDLITALYFDEMSFDPNNPNWEDRDHFVLSKGHGVPALYAVLAKLSVIPHTELSTLRQINSRLQGHPDRIRLPFVEASTGSLGQGLSIAQGYALGLKLQKKDARVFCLMGDGETQEGQVWETAMSAPKFKLNNLIGILDNNNGQIDGHVNEVMPLDPIAKKWESFGWVVHEIDGHDFDQMLKTYETIRQEKERPSLIWAKTVKGKGVSFMENEIGWHGIGPNEEQRDKAVAEIQERLKSL